MKRILLLGGYGFIGTNILKYIDKNFSGEYTVVVYDRFLKHPYGVVFQCVEKTYSGDFSDIGSLKIVFDSYIYDIVIHAITSTVPATSENCRYDIETNLIPTIDLLDLLHKYEVKKLIYLSSGGAVYGNSLPNHKHKESDNALPLSSYGVVKLATEKYLYQYQHKYDISSLILRVSNPYGPYHYSTKQGVINIALRSALANTGFTVWGDGSAQKDYIFIEDLCDILFILIQKQISRDIINIASGNILSLNKILTTIKHLIPDFEWKYSDVATFDIQHFELDTSKLQEIIGKYEFTPLTEGIFMTNEWTKNNK